MVERKEQKILNELIQDLKNKDFKYVAKEEKEIDWSSYNLARINEINAYLIFVREAVNNAYVEISTVKGPGRPPTAARDLAKIILVQGFFEVAERQASGLATLFKEKLGLENDPSPRTVGRAYRRRDVQDILGKVFEMTHEPITNKETSFSADGTGLPLSIKQNYANDRDNQEKHAGYDKAVIMISNNYHIATGFIHANGTANDCPLFAPVLEQTTKNFHNIEKVDLDAGFLSHENCKKIDDAGAIPYIYPKEGILIKQNGYPAWKRMLKQLIKDPQCWLEEYHERSQNECYFSSHKRRFSRPLLKKIKELRGVEAFVRIIATNVVMLTTAYFECRIDVRQFDKSYF